MSANRSPRRYGQKPPQSGHDRRMQRARRHARRAAHRFQRQFVAFRRRQENRLARWRQAFPRFLWINPSAFAAVLSLLTSRLITPRGATRSRGSSGLANYHRRLWREPLEQRVLLAYDLAHSLFPDPTGPQQGAEFGTSVAISIDYQVVGAPREDVGGFSDAGKVYVYNSSNTLIATLANPTPADFDLFGWSVAVSGNTVVVGANWDDTGAQDSGSAYVYDLSSGTATLTATLANPTPAASDYFGYSVAVSGNTIVVGAYLDDTGAGDAGSAYVYDVSSGMATLTATLANPTPADFDLFGWSVAVSGNTVVVGAYQDDTGAPNSGSAYVYDLSSGTATLTATLANPTPAASDYFGYSVAVSGNTVVVVAILDDTGATDSGSAYVYDVSSGTATLTATLANPTPASSDRFGWSVAVSGTTVVVGANWDDTGATNSGSAYVYDLSSGTATLTATLANPTPASSDRFGWSVAVSGTTVVVGANWDDTGAQDSGSAYVYDLASGTATLTATLTNPTPAANDWFGHSVAVSGNTVVVGAYREDTGATDAGSVYVYDLSSGTATLTATLANPTPAAGDYFGYSVAVSGNTIVVGAYLDDTGATSAGSAYVYNLASGTATLTATLANPTPAAGDQFGYSVAVSGNTIVVGAYLDDIGATDAGSAYIYDLSSGTATLTATLANPTPAANDWFGHSVAVSGNTLIVGAHRDDTGAGDAGSAYVYNLASGTATLTATLANPTPATNDRFGYSVAVSGNTLMVGAPQDDSGATGAGSAYVYNLASGTATLTATLANPTPAAGDFFGHSVAVSGNTLVVGAYLDDIGATDAGSAYVYDLASGTATLANPTPASGDQFGWSVAVSGDAVVVGARLDDTQNRRQGATYVYVTPDDYGDAPAPYPTLDADSGARHTIVPGFYLGAVVSGEINGSPSVDANADDHLSFIGDVDDEDGVTDVGGNGVAIAKALNPGLTTSLEVAVTNTAGVADPYLDVWIDFNADGDWDDAGELAVSQAVVAGVNVVDVAVPITAQPGRSYARFRLHSATAPGMLPTGSAAEGEVEDHTVIISAFDVARVVAAGSDSDRLGWATDIDGDILVAGAPFTQVGADTEVGTAYVYDVSGPVPVLQATIPNPDPDTNDWFGRTLRVRGSLLVIGAYGNAVGSATGAGTVYVYDVSNAANPQLQATIDNPSPGANDNFGVSVAVEGATVAIGSHRDDTLATNAGSVYLYDVSGASATLVSTIDNPTPAKIFDNFGLRVALSGNHLVAGIPFDETNGTANEGLAVVYDISNPSAPSLLATLNNPSPGISDDFGWWVDMDGDLVVVSAFRDDTGATNSGIAYAYDLAGITPGASVSTPTYTFENPGAAADDQFGHSVAVEGSLVVIGTRYDDASGVNAGTVYVYDTDGALAGTTFTTPTHTLDNPSADAGDEFGSWVNIDGNRIVAGAPFDDALGSDRGAAYVYRLTNHVVEFSAAVASDLESAGGNLPMLLVGDGSGGSFILAAPATVDVTVTGGTATLGTDFTNTVTVTIPAGTYDGTLATAVPISLAIVDDADFEADETIELSLANPSADLTIDDADGDTVTQGSQTYTILDDEPVQDFGDAPAPYPTLVVDSGATHVIVPGFSLGAEVDDEVGGTPSLLADGDDLAGTPDDEDGVTGFAGGYLPGDSVSLTVDVTNTAGVVDPYLDAWVDFNNDGDWDDAGELAVSMAVVAGANTITFNLPSTAVAGQSYARFRLHSGTAPGLLATGVAPEGEVEDYQFIINGDAIWDGGGADNLWTTDENWIGDVAPFPGDALVFPAGTPQFTSFNDFLSGTMFRSLDLSAHAVEGNAVSLTSGIVSQGVPSGAVVDLDGIVLLADQSIEAGVPYGFTILAPVDTNGFSVTVAGVGSTSFGGVISGSGDVHVPGRATFSAINTYAGLTTVDGTLVLLIGSTLGDTTSETVVSGTLIVQGTNDEAVTLTGINPRLALHGGADQAGAVLLDDLTNARVDGIGTTLGLRWISGVISGSATGTVTMRAFADRAIELSAANTFSGLVSVAHSGTILVTGTVAAPDLWEVGDAATLGGTGTIAGPISVAGSTATVAPGLSPGILSSGNLSFFAGSTFAVEIDGPYATAGTDFDQANVTGSVNITDAVLSLAGGTNAPTSSVEMVIINNDGTDAVTGTFAGLAEGAAVSVGAFNGYITYSGGDGNDVALIADLDDPTIVANTGATVVATSTTAITSSMLSSTDNLSAAADLTYSVTSAPMQGQLELTSAVGSQVTSFTQADLDAGLVVYVHNGSGAVNDSFDFAVSDLGGNQSGAETFAITVAQATVEFASASTNQSESGGGGTTPTLTVLGDLTGATVAGRTVDLFASDIGTSMDDYSVGQFVIPEGNYTSVTSFDLTSYTDAENPNSAVVIVDDTAVETDEQFMLDLGFGAATMAGTNDSTVHAISNTDAAHLSFFFEAFVFESTGLLEIQVNVDAPVQGGFELELGFVGIEADDNDFNSTGQTLVFDVAGTQTIFVDIYDENVVELDESFEIQVLGINAFEVDSSSISTDELGVVTIVNDDVANLSYFYDPFVLESTGLLEIQVDLDAPVQGGFELELGFVGIEADDNDFNSTGQTLVFDVAGTQTIFVDIYDENVVEFDESFEIQVLGINAFEVDSSSISTDELGVVTIVNDDVANLSYFYDPFVLESTGLLEIQVDLDAPVQGGFELELGFVGIEADDNDFNSTGQTLVFDVAGTQTIFVDIYDENVVELDESFEIQVLGINAFEVDSSSISTDELGVVTIINDDVASVSYIFNSDVFESDGILEIEATLDAPVQGGFVLEIGFVGIEADDDDFDSRDQFWFFDLAGTQTFFVDIYDENIVESDESFEIRVLGIVPFEVDGFNISSQYPGVVTIVNDDEANLSFTVANSVNETDGILEVNVSLDAPVQDGVEVLLEGVGVDATGDDFSAIAQLTFFSDAPQTVYADIFDDSLLEGTESFDLAFVHAITDDPSLPIFWDNAPQRIDIIDDETATADLSVSIHGDETAPTDIELTVTLDKVNNSNSPITFDLALADISTTSGMDFTDVSGTAVISVPVGMASGTFLIPVLDDNVVENLESLSATISNSSLAAVTIGIATANATITDNDVAGFTITESAGSTQMDEGESDSFEVVLDAIPQTDVFITVASVDPLTATVSTSLLQFTPANWNVSQSVTVNGIDGTSSADITLSIEPGSSDSLFATLPNQAVTALVNNLAPTVSSDNTSVTFDEGDTALNTGTISDPGTDAVTLTASIGSIIDNGNGTWSWSFDTSDGPDETQIVTITATDSDGAATSMTFDLGVENVAPMIGADSATVTFDEGDTAANTGSVSDPGADTITLTASVGTVIDNGNGTWSWSFDTSDGPDDAQTVTITATDSDGAATSTTFDLVVENVAPMVGVDNAIVTYDEGDTALNTGTVSDPGADTIALTASIGTVVDNGDGSWSWSYDPSDGPDDSQTVTITATDSDGDASSTTFTLVVVNVAPVVAADDVTVTVDEGNTASNTGTFGDPGADTVALMASIGTVSDSGDGTWSWSFDTSDGPDDSQTVTITATDSDGAASSATFDLVVENVAPMVGVDDATVTVSEGATASNSGTISDPGADALTLSASIGTVSDSGDGTWSWSYDTSDGPDDSQTVTVTATDSDGAASLITFDLVVENVAPMVGVDDATVTVNEGNTASNTGTLGDPGADTLILSASIGTVTDNGNGTWSWSYDTSDGPEDSQTVTIIATDSDGDSSSTTFTLTVANVAPSLAVDAATVAIAEGDTATNSGTVSDAGDDAITLTASIGTVTDNGDGTWSWSYDTNDGPDDSQTITTTATDSDGTETTTTFMLNVENVAPIVAADDAAVIVVEGDTAMNTGTLSDPGAESITLSVSIGTVTDNGDGTWNWSFDTSDGPDDSQKVTVTATDDDGAFSTTSFALKVSNVAPSIAADSASVTVEEGAAALNSGAVSDPGDDELTLNASIGVVADNGDGTWDWTFDTIDGPDDSANVTITATDSDGAITQTSFDLTVQNVAPTIDSLFIPASGNASEALGFSAFASDVGVNDELSYDWNFGDGSPTLMGATVGHAYAAPGIYTVTLTVTDDDGGVSQASQKIEILALVGDFNADGFFDCSDINALTTAIAGQSSDIEYDLTGDASVDLADRDQWLAIAGAFNMPLGSPYLLGDANLSGTVDGSDFQIWSAHKFSHNSNWCDGDFNADGSIDGRDFLIWNANKFSSSIPSAQSLPLRAELSARKSRDDEPQRKTESEAKLKSTDELPRRPIGTVSAQQLTARGAITRKSVESTDSDSNAVIDEMWAEGSDLHWVKSEIS